MKTILVVYTDDICMSVAAALVRGIKKYAFLGSEHLEIGDRLIDSRYTTGMLVVKIIDEAHKIYNGISLKILHPSRINDMPATEVVLKRAFEKGKETNNNNNMEAKNISVTLTQAIEWYNSKNSTLRTLAINAFGEDALKETFDTIKAKVSSERKLTMSYTCIPMGYNDKFVVNTKLAILAEHFNGDWKMKAGERGYFISGKLNRIDGRPCDKTIEVTVHNTIMQAGVIYFKNEADAKKAVTLLGSEINCLFE